MCSRSRRRTTASCTSTSSAGDPGRVRCPPVLHVPDRWIWDSWIADDGADYHLYFLHAPSTLGDPSLRHAWARIGHAVSPDLADWRLVDDALAPAESGWDDLALWTGSVARGDDGRWRLYYTAVNTSGHELRDQRIVVAVSDDLATWIRLGDRPIVEARPALVQDAGRFARSQRDVARPVGVPRPRRRRLAHARHGPCRGRRAERRRRARPCHEPGHGDVGARPAGVRARRRLRAAGGGPDPGHRRPAAPRVHVPPPGADGVAPSGGRLLHVDGRRRQRARPMGCRGPIGVRHEGLARMPYSDAPKYSDGPAGGTTARSLGHRPSAPGNRDSGGRRRSRPIARWGFRSMDRLDASSRRVRNAGKRIVSGM